MYKLNKKSIVIIVAVTLIVIGEAIFAYPFFTDINYKYSQKSLGYSVVEKESNNKTYIIFPKDVVAKLNIPSINLDAYVIKGTNYESLEKGPGHYNSTVLPGEKGNCAIAGHRTMYGHPFYKLDELKKGDKIITQTTKKKTTYYVFAIGEVAPDDVSVIKSTKNTRLTLTTCAPVGDDYKRLVVIVFPKRQE